MNEKVSYTIIIALAVVTLVGIALGIWLFTSQGKLGNEATVILNGEEQSEMDMNLSGIHPGMSVSYDVRLKANKGDSFDITLDFERTDTESLARFIDVEVKLDGEKLDGAKLSEYLGGRQISFSAEFNGTSELDVEILYSMALEVDDEAQNTTADFRVVLNAKR